MMLLWNYEKQAAQGLFVVSGTDAIAHCALGIAGEAGEIADMVKKSQYDPPRRYAAVDMIEELGDVVWYVTNMAHAHGYTLEEVIIANVRKLSLRHASKGVYSVEELLKC